MLYVYVFSDMATEQIQINPEVLQWARKRSGFTYEDLYNQFKKLKDWEEGASMPTYNQLESLSNKLKCPIAVFFFPAPPDIEPIRNSFRTLPEIDYELMPPSIRMLLRKAKAMQLNLEELDSQSSLSEKYLLEDLDFSTATPLEQIAKEVRRYLDVPLSTQMSWGNVETALDEWRRAFSKHGIFVFKDAFRIDEYSGFCLYHSKYPVIYINNSTSKNRQIFTLFHELAHLIFRTSGIDKLTNDYIGTMTQKQKRIEVLCNRFAAVFLVPRESFRPLIADAELSKENIKNLSQAYKVSPEVILRKLLDNDAMSREDYEVQVNQLNEDYRAFKERRKAKSSGGDFYNTQISYLGKDYVNVALQQYYRNRIDASKLASYLNIAPKSLEKFQDKFLSRGI